ncbi:acyltransferase family protein [Methylomonas sp. MgM2]
MSYYPYFDWLRMALALIVALGHEGVVLWQHAGNLSVQVFFALSGFLIGGILLKSQLEDLPRFFFNRATRIWIPYSVAIVLLLAASLLRDPVTPKWLEFVFYKATFVYNLFGPPQLETFRTQMPLAGTGNHFWSICAEEQFYLFAPLVLLLLPARIGKSVVLWAALSMVAVVVNYYGAILLGVLCAVIARRFPTWPSDWRTQAVFWWLLLTSGYLMAYEVIPYPTVAPLFAVSAVMILARTGQKSPLAQFWGGVSYPFYLNHWIGVFVANEIFEPFGLRDTAGSKIAALLLSVLMAAVLYVIVDCSVRRYRSQWFNVARGRFAAIAAYSLLATGLTGGFLFSVQALG